MDDDTLQKFESQYRDLPDARVEAELERWLADSAPRKILLSILAERRATAQQAETKRFQQSYDQTERHHASQIAESRHQSRRAEIVAWAALAFSALSFGLQFWPTQKARVQLPPPVAAAQPSVSPRVSPSTSP